MYTYLYIYRQEVLQPSQLSLIFWINTFKMISVLRDNEIGSKRGLFSLHAAPPKTLN